MKRKIFFTACVLFVAFNMVKATVLNDDTTKFDSGNKRIIVTENADKQRVEVEVYELQDGEETYPYEKIFEGHYRDGNIFERRNSLFTIDIPSPIPQRFNLQIGNTDKKCNHFHPHYAGFGMGFAGFAERGDHADIPYRTGSSPEINLNLLQKSIPLSRYYKWAIVTGFGIRWTRYHLKGNHYFEEKDDYTHLLTASEDLKFTKSKLGITTLNVPFLLEWQTRKSALFVSAGAVCSFKTASSSRYYYEDRNGKKQKEKAGTAMTLRPVTMDILVQIGTKDFGLFSRYSPISIFEKNKGPEIYPLTFGAMLYFD